VGPVTRRQAEVLGAVGERLTNAEIATRLGVSERTIQRDWTLARAWLRKELDAEARGEPG
jgi:DNA-binding NarL/FixJ family response regulator